MILCVLFLERKSQRLTATTQYMLPLLATRLNALSVEMGDAFVEKCDEVKALAQSGVVRAAVLTGAGKAFSAGGDLKWLMERATAEPKENEKTMMAFYSRYVVALREIPVPTVAALNGAAIGAGMCLSLGADVRVAAADAKLGFTFVGLGLHPGMGCTHYLPQIAGPEAAARLLLTGTVVDGTEAGRLGVVTEVVDGAEACQARAVKLAHLASAGGPTAVQTLVVTLRQAQDAGLEAALRREASAQALCYATQDYVEGLEAVKAKRRPVFTGS